MRAPSPHATVRTALADPFAIPPAPAATVQAATAWRRDVRAATPRFRLAYAASLALLVLSLAGWVASYHTPTPEAVAMARAVAR
jgi:hypothetical protein